MVKDYFSNNTKSVLELATGRGANSIYLAKKYPKIKFVGLDLPNGQIIIAQKKEREIKNFRVVEGDFHNLTIFPEDNFDFVFIVEALCYSYNKTLVLNEVNRILKPNGLFIIFDAFTKSNILTPEEILIKKLIEHGMAVPDFPVISDFKKIIQNSGFKIEKQKDLSPMIIPSLKRLEKYAHIFFKLPILIQKMIIKLFPVEFTYNSISGYLMKDSIESKLSRYVLFVLQKRD